MSDSRYQNLIKLTKPHVSEHFLRLPHAHIFRMGPQRKSLGPCGFFEQVFVLTRGRPRIFDSDQNFHNISVQNISPNGKRQNCSLLSTLFCFALLSLALRCMLCFAWRCFALQSFALLYNALLCLALLCFALHCNALLCFVLLCFAKHPKLKTC